MSCPRTFGIFLTEGSRRNMSERSLDSYKCVDDKCAQKDTVSIQSDETDNEIIDVSEFEFLHDVDEWLVGRAPCSTDLPDSNIYTWLKSGQVSDLSDTASHNLGNRKFIDTRTFTRPKKRSIRMSFESVFETLAPSTSNVQKAQNIEDIIKREHEYKDYVAPFNKLESVPPMLRPSPAINNYLPDESFATSGQESLEAFLNMSQSRGIDSFMNSADIMNMSQPSVLYSSITSMTRDDSILSTDCNADNNMEAELSLNVETKFDKSSGSSSFDKTLTRDNSINNTVLENKAYSIKANRTCYTNKPDETFTNNTNTLNREVNLINLNETYNAENEVHNTENMTVTLSHSSINHKEQNVTDLSSTFIHKYDETILLNQDEEKKSLLDDTYQVPEKTSPARFATQKIDVPKTDIKKLMSSPKRNVSNNAPNIDNEYNLDLTFEANHLPDSEQKVDNILNSTYETGTNHTNSSRQTYDNNLYSKLKAPTSLRKELLSEIHRIGAQSLDVTYNHCSDEQIIDVPQNEENVNITSDQKLKNAIDIPVVNKFNTYKKNSLKAPVTYQNEVGNHNAEEMNERKFYTFTKKTNTAIRQMETENVVPHENMDATFCKPSVKQEKKKLHAPRMSRLPQFLQKSNPNLVSSSLKSANVTGSSSIPNIRYMKPLQHELQGTNKTINKLSSLGKVQSSSVQRLLETNINTAEFKMAGAGGSTESIESTQSAHSAPDLDDRLSICSDISHNSYGARTMNIEQLHQIVRMQEESLKQESTPKPYRRVLENNWIDEKKDMPSPIMKNVIENESEPITLDTTMIVSSSPIESSQPTKDGDTKENTIQKHVDDPLITKQEAIVNKPVENKTRLKQPTNWKAGGRPSTAPSGIPRPQSRIPAPRFTRPNVKTVPVDLNKRQP